MRPHVRGGVEGAAAGGGTCVQVADGREEFAWQERLRQAGHANQFQPSAVVLCRHRPGWLSFLRRNYRWANSAWRSKRGSVAVRFVWLDRRPLLLIAAAPLVAFVHTGYAIVCWARAGVYGPLAMLPAVVAARIARAAGFVVWGLLWMRDPQQEVRPLGERWR